MYLDHQGRSWFRGNLHTHTTVSDGRKTPDETAAIYRAAGYDFLALTDHWKPSRTAEADGLLLLPGCEYDVGKSAAEGIYHIVSIGAERPVQLEKSPELSVQEVLDAIRQAGGFPILAHPAWSLNQPSEICRLRGIGAAEIFNSVSNTPWNGRRADSGVLLDTAAALGMPLPLVASDDSHFYTGEACTNFIWLQADELTCGSVMEALKAEKFYASQGPRIETEWNGRVLRVRCTTVREVVFYSNLVWSNRRVTRGDAVTEAEYAVCPGETFLRVEVIDAEGKKAWSSPVVCG